MKQPLAYRLKPSKIEDIIGQKHLVGEKGIIRKCIEEDTLFSMIFFGPPGVGKTSLAKVIANEMQRPYRSFNAVTGNKKDLDVIFAEAKLAGNLVLICDEVHRLNKDKQDLLLPHVESGNITLIGMTTANPYHSINPAIRSRCHLFKLNPLEREDVKEAILKAIANPEGLNGEYTIDDDAMEKIADTVNGDIRFALNILEIAAIGCEDHHIKKDDLVEYCRQTNNRSFGSEDGHYNLLSAFQKSIRGSDVNAALYYLALLAQSGDLDSICRRLAVIAYEDIGLANPALCARTMPAIEAAERVGLPEALYPLSTHIIDLCLAPKSRTAADAKIKAVALADSYAHDVPAYLHFTPTVKDKYDYSRYDCFHRIQYLPDAIRNVEFIDSFNNNQYEANLKRNYDELRKFKRTNNLHDLYK